MTFSAAEAELVEPVHQVPNLGRAQQRLGRDAAPVEADAAEMLALDDGGLHAELRGADGRDIAARPAADDDDVEFLLVGHQISSSFASHPLRLHPRDLSRTRER